MVVEYVAVVFVVFDVVVVDAVPVIDEVIDDLMVSSMGSSFPMAQMSQPDTPPMKHTSYVTVRLFQEFQTLALTCPLRRRCQLFVVLTLATFKVSSGVPSSMSNEYRGDGILALAFAGGRSYSSRYVRRLKHV